jgi:hypothetical protein
MMQKRPPLWSSGQSSCLQNGDVLCLLWGTNWIYICCVDCLCGLVVRVPGYRTEMYCASCEVRTEFMYVVQKKVDCLCGLVVSVPGCRSRGPGSIPGATRFSEKSWVWNGVHSASWLQLRSYLKEKVAARVWKTEITAVGDPLHWPHGSLYIQKLALTSPTSGCRSVDTVRSRTKATGFV